SLDCIVESRLDGPRGDSQVPGDLMDLHVLVVAQDNDLPVSPGKFLQGFQEGRRGCPGIQLARVFVRQGNLAASQLVVIDDPFAVSMIVAGQGEKDGVEPRVNGGATLKPVNRSNGLKECILNDVLGTAPLTPYAGGGTKQTISKSIYQFPHCPGVLTF